MKKASGNNANKRYNIGKQLNEIKLLIKAMKKIDMKDMTKKKNEENDNNYATTNLNKDYHEI